MDRMNVGVRVPAGCGKKGVAGRKASNGSKHEKGKAQMRALMREQTRHAAAMVAQIRQRLRELWHVNELLCPLSDVDKAEVAHLQLQEQQILYAGGDCDRAERIRFALLLEELKTVEPTREHAQAFLQQVVADGRYRLATPREAERFLDTASYPPGTQFFKDAVYVSLLSGSPGQSALEAELRKFLRCVRAADTARAHKDVEDLLRRGDQDLDALCEPDVACRTYACHLPRRETRNRSFAEAGLLIVVKWRGDEKVIEVIAGAGGCAWANAHKGKWISLRSFRQRRSDPRLTGELLQFSDRLIGVLKASRAAWRTRIP